MTSTALTAESQSQTVLLQWPLSSPQFGSYGHLNATRPCQQMQVSGTLVSPRQSSTEAVQTEAGTGDRELMDGRLSKQEEHRQGKGGHPVRPRWMVTPVPKTSVLLHLNDVCTVVGPTYC